MLAALILLLLDLPRMVDMNHSNLLEYLALYVVKKNTSHYATWRMEQSYIARSVKINM